MTQNRTTPYRTMNTPSLKERQSTAASFQNGVVSPKIKAQHTKHSQFNSFQNPLKKISPKTHTESSF